jgi:dienelactone hydrolase
VFAHGFQIGPGPYASFCQALAAAGYVVAAPSFPLTDAGAAGANLDRGDLPNQAGDVSFVITSVAAANGAGALQGKVDASRVGIVGHSDGADTALDTGYYPGRVDPRIKGVAALSPDAMTGPGGSVGASVPLLLQHGDRDSIVPYSNSKTVWGQVKAHRFFLTLTGADHLPPVQGAAPWGPVLRAVTIDFLDRYVAGRANDDRAILDDGAEPGVSTIVTAG